MKAATDNARLTAVRELAERLCARFDASLRQLADERPPGDAAAAADELMSPPDAQSPPAGDSR